MGIGDWGLGPIPNPQSPIPNPQSLIPIQNLMLLTKINYKNIIYILNGSSIKENKKRVRKNKPNL